MKIATGEHILFGASR